MRRWHPRGEDKALPAAMPDTRCSSALCPGVRKRRKAEREGDGPRVPWGTVSFLLISRVTSRCRAGLLADNYLAGCRKGAERLTVRGDFKTSSFLNSFGKGNQKTPPYIYFNRAISASQAGQFVTEVTHLILAARIKFFLAFLLF